MRLGTKVLDGWKNVRLMTGSRGSAASRPLPKDGNLTQRDGISPSGLGFDLAARRPYAFSIAMQVPPLSQGAASVLRVLAREASDGYTLMSKTELNADALVAALAELRDRSLVVVKGELMPRAVGDVYAVVMPDAQGYASFLLGDPRRA